MNDDDLSVPIETLTETQLADLNALADELFAMLCSTSVAVAKLKKKAQDDS